MLDFGNLNVSNYVKRFEQVIQQNLANWYVSLQTSRQMQNKFRLVVADFLSEKKRAWWIMSSDMNIFETGRRKYFFITILILDD